jgi:hypothetical protein
MKQLPGPGDTNACPGCGLLRCTCGNAKPMKESEIPTLELELAYAVETFEDENDRKPNEAELKTLTAEAREKVDSAKEAYADWKSSGGFVCEMCDKVHYGWAPKDCRDAYNAHDD